MPNPEADNRVSPGNDGETGASPLNRKPTGAACIPITPPRSATRTAKTQRRVTQNIEGCRGFMGSG